MALRRRRHAGDPGAVAEDGSAESVATGTPGQVSGPTSLTGAAADEGPFDVADFDDPDTAVVGRHDLGSVLLPENEAAELAVEVNPAGVPTMVWMVTEDGRYNVTAYAAPKTGGLWREVATEVAESLRKEATHVQIEDGPWGREVVGLMSGGAEPVVMRFVGVDGYRWMVRGTAIGTPERADAIAVALRTALSDTVIRRGDAPQPVRNMLPVQLSEPLLARLRARAEQMVAEHARQQAGDGVTSDRAPSDHTQPDQAPAGADPGAGQPAPPAGQPVARRSEQGSAMQQLRTITGG